MYKIDKHLDEMEMLIAFFDPKNLGWFTSARRCGAVSIMYMLDGAYDELSPWAQIEVRNGPKVLKEHFAEEFRIPQKITKKAASGVVCLHHPKYKGLRVPKVPCGACLSIYMTNQQKESKRAIHRKRKTRRA